MRSRIASLGEGGPIGGSIWAYFEVIGLELGSVYERLGAKVTASCLHSTPAHTESHRIRVP